MNHTTRPQYYRIKRVVAMLRERGQRGEWPNSIDFMRELEVSRRTVARDLYLLLDVENAPIEYDSARHGYHLTNGENVRAAFTIKATVKRTNPSVRTSPWSKARFNCHWTA